MNTCARRSRTSVSFFYFIAIVVTKSAFLVESVLAGTPEIAIVPFASDWRYLVPLGASADPANADADFNTTWFLSGYDDAAPVAWSGPGTAPLEYGMVDGLVPAGTNLPAPPLDDRYTAYFRHEFTTTQAFNGLALEFLIDDGAVFYLDGVELHRENCCLNVAPQDTPIFTDLANESQTDENNFVFQNISTQQTLAPGSHTFAVAVHQRGIDSSDLGMEVRLVQPGTNRPWIRDGSGDWNESDNWRSFNIPNNNQETALFGDAITSPQTVFMNAPVTVRGVQFDNANTYAVAGVGSLNLRAGTGTAASVTVTQGIHQFQLRVNLQSDTVVDVASDQAIIFNNTLEMNGHTLTKTGAGEMAIRNDFLTFGGVVNCDQGTCSGSGTVSGDLNNNGGTISPGNSNGSLAAVGVPEPPSILLAAWQWVHLGSDVD